MLGSRTLETQHCSLGWVNMDKSYSLEQHSLREAQSPVEKATHFLLHGSHNSSLPLLQTCLAGIENQEG